MRLRPLACVLLLLATIGPLRADDGSEHPNILFIAVDDLNHWLGHLGRNPQTITPNVDRLAAMGVSFSHAYCAAPACNPSRVALMSGIMPSTSGIYLNGDDPRPHVPWDKMLNAHFRSNGYKVVGAGKIYHGSYGHGPDWDDYLTRASVPGKGAFVEKNYGGIRWAQLKGDDSVVGDYRTVSYCIERLEEEHDKPFFLACGIFRPHMPWSVPKKYFDMHPLDSIQLPPHTQGDLNDIPKAGVRMAKPDGDHKKITEAGRGRKRSKPTWLPSPTPTHSWADFSMRWNSPITVTTR